MILPVDSLRDIRRFQAATGRGEEVRKFVQFVPNQKVGYMTVCSNGPLFVVHPATLLCKQVVLGCAALLVMLTWTGCSDDAPAEDRTTWHEGAAARDICITTQYTDNISAYAELAVRNHLVYAQHHGYSHVVYMGRPGPHFRDATSGGLEDSHGGGLYWQKVAAMQKTLAAQNVDGTPRCRWAMWVDADIVFTNHTSKLESIIAAFAPNDDKDMILTREQAGFPRVQLNSGAFFVKNSPGGNRFLQEISGRFDRYKDAGFPDQDAITDYVANHDLHRDGPLPHWRTAQVRDNVSLAPQRAFNSFAGRFDHFAADAQWRPCDFIAHITGAPTQDRVLRMTNLTMSAQQCATPAPLYKDSSND